MKTVVGFFDDFAQAKSAAVEVERTGVSHNDISVLANNETEAHGANVATTPDHGMGHAITKDAGVGAEVGGVLGLIAGLGLFAIPGLGWVAGAGWFAGMLAGAGAGAVVGGLIGALVEVGIPKEHATYYNEGVRRGGTLVAVRADEANANAVAQVLSSHGAVNIEERGATYRNEGLLV